MKKTKSKKLNPEFSAVVVLRNRATGEENTMVIDYDKKSVTWAKYGERLERIFPSVDCMKVAIKNHLSKKEKSGWGLA